MAEALRLKRVAIDTYRENVAYLHRDCGSCRSEGFQALSKVDVHVDGGGGRVLEVLNVVDDTAIAGIDELGLSEQAYARLGLTEGTVPAAVDGIVTEIDNLQIARIAGAPLDKGVGVDLYRKIGDPVRQGEALYVIHASFQSDFYFARARAGQDSGYVIGERIPVVAPEVNW